jgi:hypothetical protein
MTFGDLEEPHDRAVVAFLNAVPNSREHEAEEFVNSLVSLVFATMQQFLNQEMDDEQSNNQ